MLGDEKVAERAGSLVTERVRELIGSAHARAERVCRDADEGARHLDGRRAEAASRIVAQVETFEGELRRLRQAMESENAVEGSYVVDEGRLIEATADQEDDQRTDLPPEQTTEGSADEEDSNAPESDGETQTRACTVCGRELAGTDDDMQALGWTVSASGEVTCADCHSAGWLQTGN